MALGFGQNLFGRHLVVSGLFSVIVWSRFQRAPAQFTGFPVCIEVRFCHLAAIGIDET